MPLQVIDAAGATQSVETLPPKGPAAAAQSLPVAIATDQIGALRGAAPATSAPLTGNTSGPTSTIGPFTPDLARPIWLTLSGNWAGNVQLLRSTDAGATKLPLTLAGQAYGIFGAATNEAVIEESCAGAIYYLQVALSSGTLTYRLAQ